MYRTVGMAIIALAVITLPAETALAASGGGKTTAHAGTQNPPKATPQTKKLSGKAGAACFRACMRGCPARAGAISAIIPATAAADSSGLCKSGSRRSPD
jgi:hypothetical protein